MGEKQQAMNFKQKCISSEAEVHCSDASVNALYFWCQLQLFI